MISDRCHCKNRIFSTKHSLQDLLFLKTEENVSFFSETLSWNWETRRGKKDKSEEGERGEEETVVIDGFSRYQIARFKGRQLRTTTSHISTVFTILPCLICFPLRDCKNWVACPSNTCWNIAKTAKKLVHIIFSKIYFNVLYRCGCLVTSVPSLRIVLIDWFFVLDAWLHLHLAERARMRRETVRQ